MNARRRFAILDLIGRERITTQAELQEKLQAMGFAVTQATVSRDVKKLQLIKISDAQGYRYALAELQGPRGSGERMQRIFRDSVLSINSSSSLVVIKTLPGAAQAVASLIDAVDYEEILGTVAGDDTIFIAVSPEKAVKSIVQRFKDLIS